MSQSFRKSLSNQAYVGRVLACGKGDRFAVKGFPLCCTDGADTERRWWSGPRGERKGLACFCHWLSCGSNWTCARRADTSTVSFSAEGRLHGTVSILWILLISRWLARWIVDDWVRMVRFPSSLYPCMIGRDFSYSLIVVLPLISWTISELNFLILPWIRLS